METIPSSLVSRIPPLTLWWVPLLLMTPPTCSYSILPLLCWPSYPWWFYFIQCTNGHTLNTAVRQLMQGHHSAITLSFEHVFLVLCVCAMETCDFHTVQSCHHSAIPLTMSYAIPLNMSYAIPLNMSYAIPLNMSYAIPLR